MSWSFCIMYAGIPAPTLRNLRRYIYCYNAEDCAWRAAENPTYFIYIRAHTPFPLSKKHGNDVRNLSRLSGPHQGAPADLSVGFIQRRAARVDRRADGEHGGRRKVARGVSAWRGAGWRGSDLLCAWIAIPPRR